MRTKLIAMWVLLAISIVCLWLTVLINDAVLHIVLCAVNVAICIAVVTLARLCIREDNQELQELNLKTLLALQESEEIAQNPTKSFDSVVELKQHLGLNNGKKGDNHE